MLLVGLELELHFISLYVMQQEEEEGRRRRKKKILLPSLSTIIIIILLLLLLHHHNNNSFPSPCPPNCYAPAPPWTRWTRWTLPDHPCDAMASLSNSNANSVFLDKNCPSSEVRPHLGCRPRQPNHPAHGTIFFEIDGDGVRS